MKCDLCKKEIGKLFLSKIKGTYIKVDKKKHVVCSECQANFKTIEELKKALL